jgi:hypothetical protein
MVAWLCARCVEELHIRITWTAARCSSEALQNMLVSLLRGVSPVIKKLTLRVQNAPMAAAVSWIELCNQVALNEQQVIFPNLGELNLTLDGQSCVSEAQAAHASTQLLDSLRKLPRLKTLCLSFKGVHLCLPPTALQRLERLEELTLEFDAGPRLVLPAKQHRLPLPPMLKRLSVTGTSIPLSSSDVLMRLAKGGHRLESFKLS